MKIPMLLTLGLLATLDVAAQEPVVDDEPYYPQRLTAEDLLRACASSSLSHLGRRRQRFCAGFISGVEETVRLQGQQDPTLSRTGYCFPQGMSARRYASIYKGYALRDDVDLDRPAVQVVIEALADRFGCDKQELTK